MPEHPTDPPAVPDPGADATEPAGDLPVSPDPADAGDAPADRAGTVEADARVDSTAQANGSPDSPKRWLRVRRLARSKAVWLTVAGALSVGGVAWHRCGISGCPSVARLASYQPGGASVLLDRNGDVIGDLSPVKRTLIRLSKLPAHVPAAFIAVEDKRFYRHNGVDWRRVAGAALANLRSGRAVQGSSTITMQLARNVFPDRIPASERTLTRKLLEVRVAREIERRFSKDAILEMYLNHIYFGAGAYGIETASRQYFGKSAANLSVEQAALLAALLKAPTRYDPRQHASRAKARRDLVLALMLEQGSVTAEQADRARGSAVRVRSSAGGPAEQPITAPYFVAMVRTLLEDELGEDLYAQRLRIHTTLDVRLQKTTEQELERQIRNVETGAFGAFDGPGLSRHDATAAHTRYLQGAAVMMESSTGEVLALVGGRNARHSGFNRAVAGQRQVGSAFKPFVFAAALRRGWSPSAVLDDSPFRLVSGRQTWEPSNFDGEFVGPITFRDALVHSRNVPTIRLTESVGEGHVAKLARDAGLRGEIHEAPVMALGVTATSPLDLATAYTAFANNGDVVKPRLVLRVEDDAGRVVWSSSTETRTVLEPAIAYIMTDMLSDVIDHGTGRAVRSVGYDGRAAGKTGTTDDGADVWFVGYTPQMIGTVWIGFDQPRAIAARATGGSVAAPVWGRIARRAGTWTRGDWTASPQVIRLAIDPSTGLALEEGCRPRDGEAVEELFLRGREPRATCPERAGGNRSFLSRAFAWVGDLLSGDPDDDSRRRYAGEARRDDDRSDDDRDAAFYRERYGDDRASGRRSNRRSTDADRRDDDGRGRPGDRAGWVDELVDR
ncbi:MAG: PBP1A family penicillin-binding protein, partial [Gemmatimonadetes bacterium]|nr:PBP1A family penicillin-binding protein [Gemmatimonadota bacterium]